MWSKVGSVLDTPYGAPVFTPETKLPKPLCTETLPQCQPQSPREVRADPTRGYESTACPHKPSSLHMCPPASNK